MVNLLENLVCIVIGMVIGGLASYVYLNITKKLL